MISGGDVDYGSDPPHRWCIPSCMIRKTPKGYVLYSKSTPRKRLGGPYKTRAQAVKRERQVQFFKRKAA